MEKLKQFLAKNRGLIASYIIWAFFHLTLLIFAVNEKFGNCKDDFFPFQRWNKCNISEVYDFSEFFVYVTLPMIALLIYLLLKDHSQNEQPEHIPENDQ